MFQAGIPYRGKGKGPRLHDLRHTFCVHSLQKMLQSGKEPYAALPILMTYVGHKSVNATSRYIHLSAESYPALLKQTEALFGSLIPWEEMDDD
jgi:integrase